MNSHLAALISAALVPLLLPSAPATAAPVIAEFLADPTPGKSLADEDGEAHDWIEIANDSDAPLPLEGYGLSDDPAVPLKWRFPARTLAPHARLVVFASGKDRRPPTGLLHANFSLEQSGESLTLAEPNGTVVDGFLPAYPPQREGVTYGRATPLRENILVSLQSPCRYRVPSAAEPDWQSLTFSDEAWDTGDLAVGFDIDGLYAPIIGAGSDTQAAMYNFRPSAYVRVPFTIADPAKVRALELRLRYDDGVDAFINGVKVVSRFMEEDAQWDSFSTQNRADALNDRYESYDVDAAIAALVPGENILALQGSNFTTNGLDFLIDPDLRAREDDGGPSFTGYFEKPTPGAPNNLAVQGFVEDTKFSINRGFFSAPFDLVISSATPGATIRYTRDGVPPTATTGTVYTGPIRVSSSVTVRAAAFKDGYRETNVDAHTYLFTADIRTQPEMLPSVVNAAQYTSLIEPGLRSLPVVALSLRNSDFFAEGGIYAIAELSGEAQEVEMSFEYFDPPTGHSVQAGGGIRIHGGNARIHPKKPLRLYFRGKYGDPRLDFPLFPGSPVRRFDQLVLRPGGHDSWSLASTFGATSTDLPPHATFMRDQFLRRTENALGILSPQGRYVNLFINGRYWGLYDLHERPNAAYFSDHEGGSEEDYDVVHHPEFAGEAYSVVDGSGASWETLIDLAASSSQSSQAYAAVAEQLVIDDFIDHLIVRLWSGDYDWCGPIFRGTQDVTVFAGKNWYAGRRARGDQPGGYQLFCWDAEMSMGNHLMVNLTGQPVAQRVTNLDLTRADDPGSPAGLFAALRENAAFRVRFGDRVQKHFFNGGVMTAASNSDRWSAMETEIQGAVIGESARWGHETPTVLTRDTHWRPEVTWVRNTFLAGRNTTMLAQFRAAGLFPQTAAPGFSQPGGGIPEDGSFLLTMTAPVGATLYYTLDGSDPYLPPTAEMTPLVGEEAPVSALVPSVENGGADLGATWRETAEPENANAWTAGTNGVGYETTPEAYADLIRTPVPEMYASNGSVFIRIPFQIADEATLAAYEKVILRMRYDDGFVAYLNGERVAAANAPPDPLYDSVALANKSDAQAVVFESFDISANRGALRVGANMLAIQGLNDGLTSSDLLIQATLDAGRELPGAPSPNALVYTQSVPITQPTLVRARAVSTGGEWSPLTEARFTLGTPASATNLAVTEIAYRPLGPSTTAESASGATDRGAFEFVEVTNTSNVPIDLSGVLFTSGIEFAFTGTEAAALEPGEQAVIVANRSAFASRYGMAALARVAGEFAGSTNLANEGETLQLTAADGSIIQSFGYDNGAPWPDAADGNGATLELIDPSSLPDHQNPRNWRASLDFGGTPGGIDLLDYTTWTRRYFDPAAPDSASLSTPDADPDGDGLANHWEHRLAFPPHLANGHGLGSGLLDLNGNSYLFIDAFIRPGLADSLRAEGSADMLQWSSAATTLVETTPQPTDGRLRLRFRSLSPISTTPQFLRLLSTP